MKNKVYFVLLFISICFISGCNKTIDNSKDFMPSTIMISTEKEEDITSVEDKSNMPSNVQSYSIYYDFPNDMIFASNESVKLLEEYYNKINFGGDFNKCDSEVNDMFRKKYAALLINKSIVYDKDGEEFSYDYFFSLESLPNVGTKIYFFDFDGDDTPEFCTVNIFGTCIIKYLPDVDQYHLLWVKQHSGGEILGSGKIGYTFDGSDSFFYKLDAEGNEQCIISFVMGFQKEMIYMVSLPHYADNSTDVELLKSMNQAYFSESNQTYYIRVTRDKLNELRIAYEEASISAVKERVDISYFLNSY